MAEQQVAVTFEPHGRKVHVLSGTTLVEAAAQAGLTLDAPCGGMGLCGKCRVRVMNGASAPLETEQRIFTPRELQDGWRLACQTAVTQPAVVHVPETSLFASRHQIVTHTLGAAQEVLPAVRKIYVELSPPSLEQDGADLLRLEEAIGTAKADLSLLRQLPGLLRRNGFKGTAVLTDHHLIDFEAGDTTDRCFGVAFDIGTTTLVGSLLDLRSGDELAITSRMNPQVSFGDDVLSRIHYASTEPDGLENLRQLILSAVHEMLAILCAQAKAERQHIYEVTFAGNTTMQQLLCGIDVQPLGAVPFVPAYAHGLVLRACDMELPIHPRGAVYVFPVMGGFVGGDTVAGILVTALPKQEGPVLLVDIGTNGEIVLAHQGRMWAASTAAGPAFEGARIRCGMRATCGAIEKVVADSDLRLSVIGNVAPAGLCGSGLIDLASELLRLGIISSTGRLLPPQELPAGLPQPLRQRVRQGEDGQVEFVLAAGHGLQRDDSLTLTQRDVRELQLAGGAIRAGIHILLKQAGLVAGSLKHVYIAGGFGSFIRRSHAQRIGLLPAQISHERITYVGNASLNGARWVLLSTTARKRAEELARATVHVELSQDADFQMEFAEAMMFPPSDPATA